MRKKDGMSIMVRSPQSVVLYNRNMGGVDHNDQLRGYYYVRLKSHKFYKYIFWFLFEVAVTNTHILCKNFSDMTFSDVKSFRAELAKALIGDYCCCKQRGQPYPSLPQSVSVQHTFLSEGQTSNIVVTIVPTIEDVIA